MRIGRFIPAAGGAVEATPAYRAYLAGERSIMDLFSFDPSDPDAPARRALERRGFPPARRRLLAGALAEFQRRVGGGRPALEAARLLERDDALVVTVGQQPGVLSGPLFTVYKAVSALLLARRLSGRLGRPVVPVFWIVSDDHDWDEAGRLAVVTRRGEVRRLTLDAPDAGRPFGRMPVPEGAIPLMGEIASLVGGGAGGSGPFPYADEVTAFLTASARESTSVAEWFARLMARLFRNEGLVLLDPMQPEIAAESAAFYAEAVALAAEVEAALAAGAARLAEGGFPPAFLPGEHALLFDHGSGRRLGLLRDGQAFASRRGEVRHTAGDLGERVRRAPGEVSPGAALRPVLRDRLLPTVAHVAGPGEVAYLAQLKGVYRLFGEDLPPVFPRQSLTLVPPELCALLARAGLEPARILEEVARPPHALLERLGGAPVAAAFARARERIAETHGGLVAGLAAAGVDLTDLARGNLERMLVQLDYLEDKASQRQRRREQEAAAALRRLQSELLPGGRSQEKVLNVVPWLYRAGWGLAGELLKAPWTPAHQIALWEEDAGA